MVFHGFGVCLSPELIEQMPMIYHRVTDPANQTGQVLAASQNISQSQSTISDPELRCQALCKGKAKQYMEMDSAHLNQMRAPVAV